MAEVHKDSELIVKDISMTYRSGDGTEVEALNNINFTMKTGDLVVVVGPSGCGGPQDSKCAGGPSGPPAHPPWIGRPPPEGSMGASR